MMKRHTNKLPHSAAVALTLGLMLSACGSENGDHAGTDQTSDRVALTDETEPLEIGAATNTDFIAIRVEAENFSASSGGWTLTDSQNIPNILPDPDPPHHISASGFANLELLPDRRVTHDDENIGGVTFWGDSGSGPRLEYTLDIPEPGRYLVWVKSFSTGTEDNGIHVGLNGNAIPSGDRIQWCGGKNNWTWSSAQRVDENHCGVPKTIFLDIDNAGNNNIVFYAREDGFEIDQFLLLKDTTNGAIDCEPLANDQLSCKNTSNGQTIGTYDIPITSVIGGNIVSAPPADLIDIDIDLDLSSDRQTALIGDSIEYTVELSNNDTTYTATNVAVQVTIGSLLTFESSADCTSNSATTILCSPSEIAAGSNTTVRFRLVPNGEGSPRVDARVGFDQNDSNPGNNAESLSITSSPAIPDFDGSLSSLASPNVIGLVDTGISTLVVNNIGLQTIAGATLEIQYDANITMQTDNPACIVSSSVFCTLQDIAPGQTIVLPLTLIPQGGGITTITSELSISGDEDTTSNSVVTTLLVRDEPIASITDNDVAIEAENIYSQLLQPISDNGVQLGWSIDNGSIKPTLAPDFDQGDHSTASLSGYVEFLPDNRVSTQDPQIDGVSNFSQGGESSSLEYRVFFDKIGRYYVNARIRANQAEDATIHVGVNGTWPESAASITVCNPNGDWQWTNSQQTSACDTTAHATLDITSPGIHSVTLSTGTDGVEVDKLILRLNDSSLPTGLGTDKQNFTFPDLDLAVEGSITRLQQPTEEKARTFELTVQNLDNVDAAHDISVLIEGLDPSLASEIRGFDECHAVTGSIECEIHSISAAAVVVATVDIDAIDRDILSRVSVATANDTDPTNNSAVTAFSGGDTDPTNNSAVTASGGGGGVLSISFLLLLTIPHLSSIRRKSRA